MTQFRYCNFAPSGGLPDRGLVLGADGAWSALDYPNLNYYLVEFNGNTPPLSLSPSFLPLPLLLYILLKIFLSFPHFSAPLFTALLKKFIITP
jgi:hypothetical protein